MATAPAAPSGLVFTNQVCDGSTGLSISLSWNDNANNENGYRVYRDGVLVATLAANSTTYSEVAPNKSSGDFCKGFGNERPLPDHLDS